MTAGYSGTPLAQKLSLKHGATLWADAMPDSVKADIRSSGLAIDFAGSPQAPVAAAHLFVTARADLAAKLEQLLPLLARDGQIWVSWPKKSSKVDADITEDTIREVALPMGLVDVKVCAVDAVWSGLKLVIRKARR